jgi:DNA-binding transcriptional LysR family regulator
MPIRKYPQVELQLQLSVNPLALTNDSFDVCIRFRAPPDTRIIAKCIAPNRRLFCAGPTFEVVLPATRDALQCRLYLPPLIRYVNP